MKSVWCFLGAAAFCSPAAALAQQSSQAVLSKMHMTNQMEMKLGRLAEQKAASADVRAYGDRLFRDHRSADRKVENLANVEGITLQPPEPTDDAGKQEMQKQKEMAQQLQGTSGPQFDTMYLRMMVMGHEKTIAMLTQVHDTTKDAHLKNLLGKMIPILRQHLVVAEKLQSEGSRAAS